MLNRGLAMTFSKWFEATGEASVVRLKIKRAISKMMKRALVGAFEMWLERLEEAKEEGAKEAQEAKDAREAKEAEEMKEANTKVKIKRALDKMMKRLLAGSFDRWAEAAEAAKEMRVLLKRCAAKMLSRQLAGAWAKWYEIIEDKREAEADAAGPGRHCSPCHPTPTHIEPSPIELKHPMTWLTIFCSHVMQLTLNPRLFS